MRIRWREPDPTQGPNPKTFPTDRELAVLKRLAYRRFVSTTNLLHFVGGSSFPSFRLLLGKLYDGGYIGHARTHLHPQSVNARDLVHYITDKGRKILIEHGIIPPFAATKLYPHEVLSSFIYDDIEYGAEQLGIEYLGWDKLQHDTRVPARDQQHPFTIKLPSGKHLRLDGVPPPFVLRKNGKSICIPGCEVDRDTEPLRSNDLREKWTDKLKAISEFIKHGIYKTQYGFDSCLIPLFVVNAGHMSNLMTLANQTLGNPGYLLFKTVDDYVTQRNFPKLSGAMLTEPFRRINQPDLFLGDIK